jgi:ribosomal protein L34E
MEAKVCRTPKGRTDCHNHVTRRRSDGIVVCSFCGEPTRGGADVAVEFQKTARGRYQWRHPDVAGGAWSRLYVSESAAARGANMALNQREHTGPTDEEARLIEILEESVPNPMPPRDGAPKMVARYRWKHPGIAGGAASKRNYESMKSARNAAYQTLRKRKPIT